MRVYRDVMMAYKGIEIIIIVYNLDIYLQNVLKNQDQNLLIRLHH